MNFGPILSMLKFVTYNRPIFHGICKGFDCICKKRDSSLGDIGVCMNIGPPDQYSIKKLSLGSIFQGTKFFVTPP